MDYMYYTPGQPLFDFGPFEIVHYDSVMVSFENDFSAYLTARDLKLGGRRIALIWKEQCRREKELLTLTIPRELGHRLDDLVEPLTIDQAAVESPLLDVRDSQGDDCDEHLAPPDASLCKESEDGGVLPPYLTSSVVEGEEDLVDEKVLTSPEGPAGDDAELSDDLLMLDSPTGLTDWRAGCNDDALTEPLSVEAGFADEDELSDDLLVMSDAPGSEAPPPAVHGDTCEDADENSQAPCFCKVPRSKLVNSKATRFGQYLDQSHAGGTKQQLRCLSGVTGVPFISPATVGQTVCSLEFASCVQGAIAKTMSDRRIRQLI